jgi:GH15 family glucan-1,4-alpha-glucosidase
LPNLRNDLGLLAEEYDPAAGRFLGNFLQTFSHFGIVNIAAPLAELKGRTRGCVRRSRRPHRAGATLAESR